MADIVSALHVVKCVHSLINVQLVTVDLLRLWRHTRVRAGAKTEVILRYAPCDPLSSWSEGSFQRQTSNVFVANLPPHVTEQSLGQFFARCGPVGSVRHTFSHFHLSN